MSDWIPISDAYVFAQHNGEQRPVGIVAKREAHFVFAYAKSWLASPDAFALDPLRLPLTSEQYKSDRLWGAMQDSTPDTWGQKVMLATHSQKPRNEIEWLLVSRGTGAGCLLYSASRSKVLPPSGVPSFKELESLLLVADEIDRGMAPEGLSPEMIKLLWHGSSMGGARPKLTVEHEGAQWIAKLTRRDDLFDQPRAEAASLNMARASGIETPDHQLHTINGRSVLLVKRFDREGEHRQHYLSAFSLIAPERMREGDPEGPLSYLRIAQVIQKVSPDAGAEMADLYRRMVFNVAISNTDDHLKNHGFLHAGGGQYRLSPAFDLLPHPAQTSEMALTVGRQGRAATFDNALSMCERFGLSKSAAASVIEEVVTVTSSAASYFIDAGLGPLDRGILSASCKGTLGEVVVEKPSMRGGPRL